MPSTKTHEIQKHMKYKNTWNTKTYEIQKHMKYKNTWNTKTHEIQKHMKYKNTWNMPNMSKQTVKMSAVNIDSRDICQTCQELNPKP